MPPPDVLVGGRYRLVERIAAGGMGSVWEAWDDRLHRRVALKQLHPQPGLSPAEAALSGDRVMREARITARLHHAHAVQVYDIVDVDGQPCLIMEYLPSKSLHALVRERGTLEIAEVARIGSQVAAALTAAHALGIVHRDVKPGNVLIDEDGAAKLTDFGISHAAGDPALTSTGMVTGTPAYLAPEVARGVESSPASDVFSLGSTLYAAAEGSPPFGTDDNPMAMLHRVASGHLLPARRSGPLTPVLMRMLSLDPAARPAMREVSETLAAVHAVASDPTAGDRTQRLAAAPQYRLAMPSSTVVLPAAGATSGPPAGATSGPPAGAGVGRPPRPARAPGRPGPPHHRRRVAIGALMVALVVGLAVVVGLQLAGGDSGGHPVAGGASGSTGHSSATRPATSSSRSGPSSHTQTSPAKTSGTNTKAAKTKAAKHKTPTGPTANGADLKTAIADYYALLPDNTAAAWTQLTPGYQHSSQAGGRANYESFWNGIRSVAVSGERADPASRSVVASIRYVAKTGAVSSERRSFRLARQGGSLKIAGSNVVGG